MITRAKNGELRVDLHELRAFLNLVAQGDENHHHAGLHAELGFYGLAERERTKRVHRLHPYLGKFIPQLVQWFLSRYFKQGDLLLDPFMGSGTMLIQANEMGMHAIGVDMLSHCLCKNAKIGIFWGETVLMTISSPFLNELASNYKMKFMPSLVNFS